MLIFNRRVQGQRRPTKSGIRLRFVAFIGQEADEDDDGDGSEPNAATHLADRCRPAPACQPTATGRCLKESRPISMLLLLLPIIISTLSRPSDCDQSDNNSSTIRGSSSSSFLGANHDLDTLRVAAFATKLEHWFACRRHNTVLAGETGPEQPAEQPAASQQHQGAAGSGGAHCAAHHDGHLCWPPAAPNQTVRLPCPRLHWLPASISEQLIAENKQHLVKSVISSIQMPARRENETTNGPSPARGAVTGDAPITQDTFGPSSNKQQEPSEERYAYRKCTSHQNNKDPQAQTMAQWQTQANYGACHSQKFREQPNEFDPTDKWIKLDQEPDKRIFSSLVDELDRIEATIDPYSDPDLQEQWSLCIGNIMRHHHHQQQQQQQPTSSGVRGADGQQQPGDLWCPIIFDGWRCWPSTRASEVAYVSCPNNQPGFSAERKAHKICTPDGSWYKHPMTNRYWSNYTTCVDTVDLAFRKKIVNLYVIGNLISLIALSASLIIFISFKSLNCTRVTIHKNLFLSFITNNLMWIIWFSYVVNDADLLQKNPIECQFWHILCHYFLVSNYFWMFCEGLYLHTLLVVAFVSEDKILKWFYLLGWLTPVPITVAYAYTRSYDDYYTSYCWMEESPYNLILMAPIGISLLLNLVFLINIVRVLVTKLRANNSPDTHQTRKAVRATLILIPLLGLHYILTPFRPEAKSEWEVIYESVAAVCTSFQGLCVAMLFCFCNGEVINAIKKKLKDTFNLSHSRPLPAAGGNGTQFMRNRSNTTCTSIGIMGSGYNGSGGSIINHQAQPQSQRSNSNTNNDNNNKIYGSNLASLPSKLFQETYSPPSATTNNNHKLNGTNSNTSNSSSILTTATISTFAAVSEQQSNESNPLISFSSLATTVQQADNNNGPDRHRNCSLQEEPLASCKLLDHTLVQCRDPNGLVIDDKDEESVRLLQNRQAQAGCSVTTSFSVPI